MRVLLTTDTIGGVWTFTKELTQQLLIRGDSVALVSFGRAPSAGQRAWADEAASTHPGSFALHACDAPLEWMLNNELAWSQGGEFLIDVAERFQPDVLHSSQFCWGALPLDIPKLITAHSDVRSWAAACSPTGLASSPWLERYDALVQGGIDCADAIAAPTAWMRDALRMHFAVTAPFHVVANGRTLANRKFDRERELCAVSVGRLWDEGKGLAILREIVSPVQILLAGERCFEGAESTVSQARWTSLGMLDEKSLLDLFGTSSIYLATSLYEPFGLAPLEAALCGCAIVARDIPSLREVWGDAALFFENANSLQRLLSELAEDPDKLCRFRVAAEERARSFNGKRLADRYASLYRQLILKSAGGVSTVEEEMHAA
jgi:glycogen(starch) synthase